MPGGVPVPPSLETLLAYDASWLEGLGWLTRAPAFAWTPRTLAEIAEAEIGFGDSFDLATMRTCFPLPGGADSRRVLVVTPSPDALGEFPIVLIDTDDVPFLCVYMAGLDVFLGDYTRVQPVSGKSYDEVARDARFRARMDHHGRKLMKGRIWTDFPMDTLRPRPRREGRNPFTGQVIVLPEIPAGEVPIDWDASED